MRALILCFFVFLFTLPAGAQVTSIKITDKTIVKDSSGTVYPIAIWQPLLSKGYVLKPVDPRNASTEFILVKLTEQQIAERMKNTPKPRESSYFKTGEKLNLFKASDIDGNKFDLRDSSGKIIVINFWFINCGPCRREIPELNDLVDSFSTNDKVLFYAVALDEKQELKTFLEKMPFKYKIIDNGRFITEKYGIRSYPTHLIIDTDGKVYFHTVGLASNTVYWLKKSIGELLEKSQ
ncbi:MAG TPA: TlpA disulfide reductase family protein [Flavisolibacter sp.]